MLRDQLKDDLKARIEQELIDSKQYMVDIEQELRKEIS